MVTFGANANRGSNGSEPVCFDPFCALIGWHSFDRLNGSMHYASQQAAKQLPCVFTPTIRMPPPIFCFLLRQSTGATFDDLQHVEVFDCERSGAAGLCEWRETQCVGGHRQSRCYAIALEWMLSPVLCPISEYKER